jgi:hypothetical protein
MAVQVGVGIAGSTALIRMPGNALAYWIVIALR